MQREYGIGRIPADVDETEETLAELAAIERTHTVPVTRETPRCEYCGTPCNHRMWSNWHGRVCPDCYDLLGGEG